MQTVIQNKKKKKPRDMTWTELSREEYGSVNKLVVNRAVARARHEEYKDLNSSLELVDSVKRAVQLAKKNP